MSGYIIRRLLAMIPVLLVVALVVFALIHIAPGDPAALIVGTHATAEKYELIRESLGLNEPMYVQLGIWLGNLFQGDLGESLFGKTSVTEMISQRIRVGGRGNAFQQIKGQGDRDAGAQDPPGCIQTH